jgi:hypothetical protein
VPWWLEVLDWLRVVVQAVCFGAIAGYTLAGCPPVGP